MQMRTLILLLLSFGLLACAQDNDGNADQAKSQRAQASKAQGKGAKDKADRPEVEASVDVPADYQPAFPKIENKDWYLTEFEFKGRSVRIKKEGAPHFKIVKGKIIGNGGCNNFSGEVSLQNDGTLQVSKLASTKGLCQGKMMQETRFFEILEGAASYSVNKIFLEVDGSGGKMSLRATYNNQPQGR